MGNAKIEGNLSIDTRGVDEVRAQLAEKHEQAEARVRVIDEAKAYLHTDEGKLIAPLKGWEMLDAFLILTTPVPDSTPLSDDASLDEVHAALIDERNRTQFCQDLINQCRAQVEAIPSTYVNAAPRAHLFALLNQID